MKKQQVLIITSGILVLVLVVVSFMARKQLSEYLFTSKPSTDTQAQLNNDSSEVPGSKASILERDKVLQTTNSLITNEQTSLGDFPQGQLAVTASTTTAIGTPKSTTSSSAASNVASTANTTPGITYGPGGTVTLPPNPTPTPIPIQPTSDSWTDSHGTFSYHTMPGIMYTGKDMTVTFGYSSSTCPSFATGAKLLVPANTTVANGANLLSVSNGYMFPDTSPSEYYLDLSGLYKQDCGISMGYIYTLPLTNVTSSFYYPGNWDMWW